MTDAQPSRIAPAAGFTRRGVLGLIAAAPFAAPALGQGARPAPWAVPVVLEGVPNLHQVTPWLYRSAQPFALGFQALAAMGIRSVVSLRQTVDDAPLAEGTGLALHRVRMKSRNVGERDGAKVVMALRLVFKAKGQGPVLLHCHHGADRTGAVSAVFRMAEQGWSHEAALDELLNGGFGFHRIWQNIPRYVSAVDIDDIRRRLQA